MIFICYQLPNLQYIHNQWVTSHYLQVNQVYKKDNILK